MQPDASAQFFGHPRGLKTLFFTELWERFSYYGMRAILILYMTAATASGGLGFDVGKAGAIYGTYTALVYLACLPGGWLADRFFGQRYATLWGGIIIMSGHVCLALPSGLGFYPGLALVVIGTGLLKPNISTMVGQLYAPADARRDAGFSIYYMGINLGAFMAPLVCGWLGQGTRFHALLASVGIAPAESWHFGFGAAAVGMLFGLLQYWAGWRHLGGAGLLAGNGDPARDRRFMLRGLVVFVALAALFGGLLQSGRVVLDPERLGDMFGILLLLITVGFFAWLFTSGHWTAAERRALVVVLVLFFGATVFWSLFEQGGSTLNLFAERNTDHTLFGLEFPASWLQSLNAILIVCLAPVFAWLWVRLGKHEPSSPAKFTLGLFLVAAGFAILVLAAEQAEAGVRVSAWWLVGTYFIHTLGELCLSPVGLSAMTKLAPARIAGLTMGVWFLATSVGNYLGGRVASLYDTFTLPQLFGTVTLIALLATLLMAFCIAPIRRMLAPK